MEAQTKLIDGISISYSSYLEELKKAGESLRIHNITASVRIVILVKVIRKSKNLATYAQPKSYRIKKSLNRGDTNSGFREQIYCGMAAFISKGNQPLCIAIREEDSG